MRHTIKGGIMGVLFVILLLATITGAVWAQTPITRLRNIQITVLTVLGGLETDDITLTMADPVVVTNGSTITPGGIYQPIESAGNVGTSDITAGDAGDLLILTNTANTSIVLTDTGTLKLGGNRTLGQYDTLTLMSDGTNWLELAFGNN